MSWMRYRIIGQLALPISLSLLAQVVVLLVNSAMIGWLGVSTLAGVGVASEVYAVFAAILFGVDAGVQAMVARRMGEGKLHLAGEVLTNGIALSVLVGAVLATIAIVAGPSLLHAIVRNAAVDLQGLHYLRAISPALLFTGANYAFGAYWNGSGAPKYTFLVTMIQLPCSIIFSFILIFGSLGLPRLEATGAGLGALAASGVALGVNLALATRFRPVADFPGKWPSWTGMATVLKIGGPISVEQSTLHVGTTVFFSVIGLLGTAQVAVVNVVIGLDHLAILPAIGIGIATATLVGASLGGQDVASARRWGWQGGLVGVAAIFPISVVVFAIPGTILGLFIHDPAAVAIGIWPARFLALSMCINTFGRVVGFGIRGSGATMLVAGVNFAMQWFVQLPVAYIIGIWMHYGLFGIAAGRLALLTIESVILVLIWRSNRWSAVRIPVAAPEPVGGLQPELATVEINANSVRA
jgi:multidrug resistance protein, MATE family